MPKSRLRIGGTACPTGRVTDTRLEVSQRITGEPLSVPIRVVRAAHNPTAPTVFVSAVIHGDELNGMGIVHELMFTRNIKLKRGTVIFIPVVNVFGFEGSERYMPDRRDLNRGFPGSPTGSLTSRIAHVLFREVISKCDYGIDLHTAAAPRTNFPNVRGDMTDPAVRRLACAFGCELMVNGKGPVGSLRREATRAGCPTIILEAGEPGKIEPGILETGVRGVLNVLKELDMVEGEPTRPIYQSRVDKATWVRAENGGILRFHVAPGEPVECGQAIATTTGVFGRDLSVLTSPVAGIVLGMTTLPTLKPGEPVCHIAVPRTSMNRIRRSLHRAPQDSLAQRLRDDLATNISISDQEVDWATPPTE